MKVSMNTVRYIVELHIKEQDKDIRKYKPEKKRNNKKRKSIINGKHQNKNIKHHN